MSDFKPPSHLKAIVANIEKSIIITLIAVMSILLVLATIELIYYVFLAVAERKEGTIIIDLDILMQLFGAFLLVLIGIELLDTTKVYFKSHVIHVEVVMLVALIAIARKVIVLDFDKYDAMEIIAVAVIILAVSGGYYLIKKAGGSGFWPKEGKLPQHPLKKEAKNQLED